MLPRADTIPPSGTGWGCPERELDVVVAGMGWWGGITPLSACGVCCVQHRKGEKSMKCIPLAWVPSQVPSQVPSCTRLVLCLFLLHFLFLLPGSQQPPPGTRASPV